MVEETPKQEPTDQEKILQLAQIIKSQQFFSDQVQFNATIWQGMNIILKKLTNIEEMLKKVNGIA